MAILLFSVLTVGAMFAETVCQPMELDETFLEQRKDGVWLVEFYAPWCGHCKNLEPVWNEVATEMQASMSPIRVGKLDATVNTGVASEFEVHGFPTIKVIKGDLTYNYRGPRTKDDIMDFANRVAGPAVRLLTSSALFDHTRQRQPVFFLYVGSDAPLKEVYIEIAKQLVVKTQFFATSQNILPQDIQPRGDPTILVFKDDTWFHYDEAEDGDLKAWVTQELFPSFLEINSYSLYDLSESGRAVVMAIAGEKTEEELRLKSLLQSVAIESHKQFHQNYQFGFMNGPDYMNNILMSELPVPCLLVYNFSNRQYFKAPKLPSSAYDVSTFLTAVLNGEETALGGDGLGQRLKRFVFDTKQTIKSIMSVSPLLACIMFGLPMGIIGIMCYWMCTADDAQGQQGDSWDTSDDEAESPEALSCDSEQMIQDATGRSDEGPSDLEDESSKPLEEKKMD